MLLSKRDQEKRENHASEKYPKLVRAEMYGSFQRLRARLGMAPTQNQLFLGHCRIHKRYFVDRQHTNGVIRCPICDAEWLRKHGFSK